MWSCWWSLYPNTIFAYISIWNNQQRMERATHKLACLDRMPHHDRYLLLKGFCDYLSDMEIWSRRLLCVLPVTVVYCCCILCQEYSIYLFALLIVSLGTSTGIPEHLYRSGQHIWWHIAVGYCWTHLQGTAILFEIKWRWLLFYNMYCWYFTCK